MFPLEDKFYTFVIALLSLYNWDTNNVSAAWLCLKMNFFRFLKIRNRVLMRSVMNAIAPQLQIK